MTRYRALDAGLIVTTARALERRIGDRFPESGLSQVARELVELAEETGGRIAELARPRWGLRAAVGVLIALIVLVAGMVVA